MKLIVSIFFLISFIVLKSFSLERQNNTPNFKNFDNEAQKNMRRWDLKTAPIAFLARWLTFDLGYYLTSKWSVGPSTILFLSEKPGGMLAPSYKGYAWGIDSVYLFSSVHQNGFNQSVHAYYDNFESYPHAARSYYKNEGFRINSAIGYTADELWYRWFLGLGGEFKSHQVQEFEEDLLTSDSNFISEEHSEILNLFIEFKVSYRF